MKHFTFILLFIAICGTLRAQTAQVSGRVVDAKTGEALPFTNVYINNSTIGVMTDTTGRFVFQSLPIGATEIVFSFVGYLSQQLKIVVKEKNNAVINMQLVADSQQLSEVAVKAGRDKTWEKQVKRFEKVFFGNTAKCKILNPWVIDFTEKNGLTTAKAGLPLEIENQTLGYKLFFQLKKFGYSATEFSIVGNVRFVEMETTDASMAQNWSKGREAAYHSSPRHLMKSILDHEIGKQGFVLYRDKVKGKMHGNKFSAELEENIIPYDTTALLTSGPGLNEFRIAVKERMEAHYVHDFTKSNYYSDVTNPVSWIETRNGYIVINRNGTILNATDVSISGNMSDGRVGDMLPLDFKPGTVVVPQSATELIAKRLEEKVYIHTDKPYYYPGENIWFSGYMNYRVPGLRDSLSTVLYVDLINNDKVAVQRLILQIGFGRTAGSFKLPTFIKAGNYVLRAYTQWMRNYGTEQFLYKPIKILNPDESPEGIASKPVADHLMKIVFDKADYERRGEVKMSLAFDTTGTGALLNGNFSVSVYDESLTLPVVEPTSIKRDFELHGPAGAGFTTLTYPIEKGISLDGSFLDKKGNGKKAKLTLVPQNMNGIYQTSTSISGAFSIHNLPIFDSTTFVVQPTGGKIVLNKPDLPVLPEQLPIFEMPLARASTPRLISSWDTLSATTLAEFKVKGKKLDSEKSKYGKPDYYIKSEKMAGYSSIADVISSQIPNFKLISGAINWFLIWGRASLPNSTDLVGGDLSTHEPNLYIDDVLVSGETVGNRLMRMDPSTIDHIEANGMITSNQGANGSSGLINVYTKQGSESNSPGLSLVKVRGYDTEKTFPSPNYGEMEVSPDIKDYRSTLYWNPRVQLLSKNAQTQLSFFTSDHAGNYRVVVEGVTSRGPVRSEAVITVRE